jgi:hypothetical protein
MFGFYASSSQKVLLTITIALCVQACTTMKPSVGTHTKNEHSNWQNPIWDGPNTTAATAGYTEFRGRFALEFGAKKTALMVNNPCGDILIKDSNKSGWLGATVIGQQAPDTQMPKLRYRQRDSNWVIELMCPDRSASKRSRMDLNLFVPPLSSLKLNTTDGNMRALSLKAPAIIETTSGRLMLGNNQNTSVRSSSGDVFLSVNNATLSVNIASDTGQIELAIPDKNVLIEANCLKLNNQLKSSVIKSENPDAKVKLKTKKGAITLLPALVNE